MRIVSQWSLGKCLVLLSCRIRYLSWKTFNLDFRFLFGWPHHPFPHIQETAYEDEFNPWEVHVPVPTSFTHELVDTHISDSPTGCPSLDDDPATCKVDLRSEFVPHSYEKYVNRSNLDLSCFVEESQKLVYLWGLAQRGSCVEQAENTSCLARCRITWWWIGRLKRPFAKPIDGQKKATEWYDGRTCWCLWSRSGCWNIDTEVDHFK